MKITKIPVIGDKTRIKINISPVYPLSYISPKSLNIDTLLNILNDYKYTQTHNKYFIIFSIEMRKKKKISRGDEERNFTCRKTTKIPCHPDIGDGEKFPLWEQRWRLGHLTPPHLIVIPTWFEYRS